jgi:uncharacterized protein (TIGR03435 family)
MMGPMLQALLENRFQLKIHRETEEAPMYALTVAKSGLKLLPTPEGGCTAFDPARTGFIAPGEKLPCGFIQTLGSGPGGTKETLDAGGVSLDKISGALSGILDLYVIDKTGITGTFNVHLEFARDERTRSGPVGAPPVEPSEPPSAPRYLPRLSGSG